MSTRGLFRPAVIAFGILRYFAAQQFYRAVEIAGQLFPDEWMGNSLRGFLLRPFLHRCGRSLQVSLGVRLANPKNIELGDNVYIGNGCWLNGVGGGIIFEDEVMLGPYVTLVSNNHSFRDGSARFGPGVAAPIFVGAGTWIAAHATITAGVSIGRGCLVAAGAVVTKSLPDGSVAAGVPARVIGRVVSRTAEELSGRNGSTESSHTR